MRSLIHEAVAVFTMTMLYIIAFGGAAITGGFYDNWNIRLSKRKRMILTLALTATVTNNDDDAHYINNISAQLFRRAQKPLYRTFVLNTAATRKVRAIKKLMLLGPCTTQTNMLNAIVVLKPHNNYNNDSFTSHAA